MEPGEFRAHEEEPDRTGGGELLFQLENGDALVKATPPKRNILFFQMRKIEGTWRVVAEYTG